MERLVETGEALPQPVAFQAVEDLAARWAGATVKLAAS